MPVYLRKNVTFTPSSLGEFPPEDHCDADYLQDPEQHRDELPQPYRMVNKFLTRLIDTAWEILDSREQKRVAEACKIRPPQYECAITMQEHPSVCCMASSPDGAVVVVGTKTGLSSIDGPGHQTLGSVDLGVAVVNVQVSHLGPDVYMVAAIDNAGAAELYVLSSGRFYLLEKLNEQQEGGSKLLATRLEASAGGHYVGVYLETAAGKEGVLHVHKLPKEVWLKEAEQALSKESDKPAAPTDVPTESSPRPPTDADMPIEYSHPSEGPGGSNETDHADDSGNQASGTPKGGSPRAPTADRMTFKFTPSNLILKVRPPSPVQGVLWQTPLALLKTCDTGDVIGTGISHQVSQAHLEHRNEAFTNRHKHHLPYLQEADIQGNHMCPTFHFLTPGRMIAQGLENGAQAGMDQPNTIAVWWRGHYQLSQYSLLKSSKDLEHKPEQMWPQAEKIVASAVSSATSLIALGLRNGHLVIWDKYLGMHRRLLQVTEEDNIAQLHFLDSRICPQECTNYPPYDTRTNCYVLVWCCDGKLILVNCGLWNSEEPQDVSAELESEDDQYCQVIPIQGIPELVLTCRHNGNMFLHDILDGRVLCQVKLPDPFALQAPWEPVVSVGAQGETLYIKGTSPDAKEEAGSSNSAVFVFQLRSFPTLDGYRTLPRPDVPEVVHSTVENRVNALLTERMTQQVLRKSRMQERWYKMKDELELMKKARNTTKTPKSFSVSTIERSVVNASPEKSII